MPYFRDADGRDDPWSNYEPVKTDAEKLETVRWYIWCGYGIDARSLLHEVAKSIPESWDAVDAPSYEEKRFDKENYD